MADGIPCKYCGYMETEHCLDASWVQDEDKIVEGRSISLKECAETKGFTPEEV